MLCSAAPIQLVAGRQGSLPETWLACKCSTSSSASPIQFSLLKTTWWSTQNHAETFFLKVNCWNCIELYKQAPWFCHRLGSWVLVFDFYLMHAFNNTYEVGKSNNIELKENDNSSFESHELYRFSNYKSSILIIIDNWKSFSENWRKREKSV